jgi:hypothetical protein
MECEVCRARGLRRQAAEGTGGRERQAQEAAGGGDARQRDAQGRCLVAPAVFIRQHKPEKAEPARWSCLRLELALRCASRGAFRPHVISGQKDVRSLKGGVLGPGTGWLTLLRLAYPDRTAEFDNLRGLAPRTGRGDMVASANSASSSTNKTKTDHPRPHPKYRRLLTPYLHTTVRRAQMTQARIIRRCYQCGTRSSHSPPSA